MTHPPGTVIVPCQETARFHRFTWSLMHLEMPEGSQKTFGVGGSIVNNLNESVRELRPQDEWVWLIGDDHSFETDTLMRLLDRDADIIAPLCVKRIAPFPLVHYPSRIEGTHFYSATQFEEIPLDGEPFEVEVSGSALLIRRHVLDVIGDPWFGNTNSLLNEDLNLCASAREHGFTVLVDPSVAIGHIGQVTATPELRDGIWGLAFDFNGSTLFMPGGIDEKANLGRMEARLG